jgi:hypothetical protein
MVPPQHPWWRETYGPSKETARTRAVVYAESSVMIFSLSDTVGVGDRLTTV